ncbi:MAG: LacI family DNA-binding transcriptional regulator [Candidatus Omnitrophica bacterium]|nr:LacI family DNA-binding transcriptional regulator [Candidatus Omnitrophota bacterium]
MKKMRKKRKRVTRVINNNTAVKAYNKEKVERVIKELDFRPDVSARRLAGGKTNTIGIIIPRFDDMFRTYYITEVMRSVCQRASRSNLDVLVHLTSKDVTQKGARAHLENISLCSGVIFADIQGNEPLLEEVMGEDIPCVVMNYFDKNLNAGCISIDNKGGAKAAVDYIISLGHQRIATITGDLAIQAGKDRLEGYKESLNSHGIPIDDELIKKGDFSPQSAKKCIRAILKADAYPTAIFIGSDEMALEAIKALRDNKIRMPQDISIVGFDDSWFARQGGIALTTIRQPLIKMGEAAVEEIRRTAFSKEKGSPRKIMLPTELVVRESCVPPLRREDFY